MCFIHPRDTVTNCSIRDDLFLFVDSYTLEVIGNYYEKQSKEERTQRPKLWGRGSMRSREMFHECTFFIWKNGYKYSHTQTQLLCLMFSDLFSALLQFLNCCTQELLAKHKPSRNQRKSVEMLTDLLLQCGLINGKFGEKQSKFSDLAKVKICSFSEAPSSPSSSSLVSYVLCVFERNFFVLLLLRCFLSILHLRWMVPLLPHRVFTRKSIWNSIDNSKQQKQTNNRITGKSVHHEFVYTQTKCNKWWSTHRCDTLRCTQHHQMVFLLTAFFSVQMDLRELL